MSKLTGQELISQAREMLADRRHAKLADMAKAFVRDRQPQPAADPLGSRLPEFARAMPTGGRGVTFWD
jgi:hypothetical protein